MVSQKKKRRRKTGRRENLEVKSTLSFPTEALVWITEVDSVKHMDEFKSTDSILARVIPDFEVLDSKIASALKKLEEQKAQQDNRFLKGRQIANMIHDYFKISGTGEALLEFNDLLRVQLKNDNVQGFDTK